MDQILAGLDGNLSYLDYAYLYSTVYHFYTATRLNMSSSGEGMEVSLDIPNTPGVD